jgi:hypothetical protein
LVKTMSKAPKPELVKITPTMLTVIAQMKQAVAAAKAKLAANSGTVSQAFLEQLVGHAEGVIAMAENLVVLGPTGEVVRSTGDNELDARARATDAIKAVRSGGGINGPGAIWGY